MKLSFTRTGYALGLLLGLSRLAPAQTVYTPKVVTGYTADVIADGRGPVNGSTTNAVDRGNATVRWCFANTTFINPAGQSPTQALPANSLITSISTPGLQFQMGPAAGFNSLRIDGAGSGTLTLAAPDVATEVVVLATEGNGSTAPKTFVITFTDGTMQAVGGIQVPDWFSTTGATPAIIVGSRVSYIDNSIDNVGNNPRIFEVHVPLTLLNYGKLVQSVTISKTSTDPVLNVMGLTLGVNCLGVPVGGTALASPAAVCPGQPVQLSLAGNTTAGPITYQWQSAPVGSTTFTNIQGATGATYTANPTASTQYRAQVVCSAQSSPSTPVTVTVTTATSALAYVAAGGTASFCQTGTQAVLTATPAGGTFSSSGTGLSLNATTGALNLATSTAGTYTVSYAPPTASCAPVATATITVLATPVARVSYGAQTYCQSAGSTTPTAVSPAGGTFSGTGGLVINAGTGVINLAQTPAGSYTVTYTTAGPCVATTTVPVAVQAPAPVALSYPVASACQSAGTVAPATASPSGGTFSAPAGLVISASTGVISLAGSTPGTYAVTYAISGVCSASATASFTVLAAPAVTLTYPGTEFCKSGTVPTATVSPAGGVFSTTAGLVLNANTGTIDLVNTPNGTYTVTYTSPNPCSAQATARVVIKGNNPPIYPNVLTPNNDGKNDKLKLAIADVQGYSMQVFSRWGRQVFTSSNVAEAWDPTDSAPGLYYYLVRYTDCNGRAQEAKTWIEVIK